MNELLTAVSSAWAQAGHDDLAAAVNRIAVPEVLSVPARGVPQHLARDYKIALDSMLLHPQLRTQLALNAAKLHWATGGMTMPESFRDRYCYCELAGPDGMIGAPDIRFGVYLQARDTDYPRHWHEAREHYLVLSGTAQWQTDDDPHVERNPGEAFLHAENQPHATLTDDQPLLALWIWQGDIRMDTYRIVGING